MYLKTGNQSLAEDADIENTGYKVFYREDLLAVLNGYQGTHPIVTDFRDHIQGFEDDFNSFDNWRHGGGREKWTRAGWEGFYRRLDLPSGPVSGAGLQEAGGVGTGGPGPPGPGRARLAAALTARRPAAASRLASFSPCSRPFTPSPIW